MTPARPSGEHPSETADPAAVYLCQAGGRLSCGACCGLYNVEALSRERLEHILVQRTADFAGVPRTEAAIEAYERRIEGFTPPDRPFPRFYHCPFLGLVGTKGLRVGCLLHPSAPGNGGVDFRWLSYYGKKACETYFCPTTRRLPGAYQQIILAVMDHWYAFGLVITEQRLLTALFGEIESRIGRKPVAADFSGNDPAASALKTLLELKLVWPYRRPSDPGPCNYFFENGLYLRPPVQRSEKAIGESHYETLFCELDSVFASAQEQETAEERLDRLLDRVAASLIRPHPAAGAQTPSPENGTGEM